MKPLLFLSQRIPFPPNKGDKLRSFAVLRHLAKSWDIHLGCFIDDPNDWQYMEPLKPYCADLHCVGLNKRWATLRSLQGFAVGSSLSEPYFRDGAMAAWVDRMLGDVRPEAAFLYSSVMGQYLLRSKAPRPRRVVMDFVDVDSDKWQQYATQQAWPMNWVYSRESRRLLAFDRRLARQTDASIFVSTEEADLFRQVAPDVQDRTHAISNGVDHAYFTADPGHDDPYPPGSLGIVFTGAMDYWPNVDAVAWFAEEMFPRLRARLPDAVFHIVGGNPAPRVQALASVPGVTVTGRVPDVRPYLTHARVAVAPMRVARGIQNKILEGMSMGKVVVTTSQGLEGISAEPERDLLVADDVDGFIEKTLRALTDPAVAAIGDAARRRILSAYNWDDKLAQYERLLT